MMEEPEGEPPRDARERSKPTSLPDLAEALCLPVSFLERVERQLKRKWQVIVGDAKYKNLTDKRVPSADLYQLLAYTTVLDLPGGLLIYAQGEADTASYIVKHTSKRLEVVALDLSGSLNEVLSRTMTIASKIRELRADTSQGLIAA